MTFLPIVERELRAAARRRSTYRMRTAVAVLASLLAAGLILLGNLTSGKQMGSAVFHALSALGFFYCLLAGARNSADALSEEKREGTMGLLFLTDLRGFDIVAGKLVSTSAKTLQGLFTFFPVLATALVLGGTTAGEFWRTTLVLTTTLFLALTTGLWVSALSREASKALAATATVLLLICIAPIFIDWILTLVGSNKFWGFLVYLSPAMALEAASDASYHLKPYGYWCAILSNQLLACALLSAASLQLPHLWQDKPAFSLIGKVERPRQSNRTSRNRNKAALLRPRLLEINPILWLASRNDRHRWLIGFVTGMTLIAAFTLLMMSRWFGGVSLGASSALTLGFGWILKVWVAWQACSTLAEARRTGAVELLLATPLTVEQIIRGHWQALHRFFLWPAIAALVLRLAPVIEELLKHPQGQSLWFFLPIPAVTLFGMVTFAVDLVALAWVGMWLGLSQSKAVQAFAKTILFVMIGPSILFCLPNLLFDFFWITWARQKLERQFRQAAANQYSRVQQPSILLSLPPPPTAAPSGTEFGGAALPPIISSENSGISNVAKSEDEASKSS